MRKNIERLFGTIIVAGIFATAALAEIGAKPTDNGGCNGAPNAQAPTPSDQGPRSGAHPGNSGSTGWTGDAGPDRTPSGALPGSNGYQPPVARGSDLKMPDPASKC